MRKRILLLAGLLVLVIIGGGFYTTLARPDTKEDKQMGAWYKTTMLMKCLP